MDSTYNRHFVIGNTPQVLEARIAEMSSAEAKTALKEIGSLIGRAIRGTEASEAIRSDVLALVERFPAYPRG